MIDKEGIVRHPVVNDMPLGRSIDKAIRMVDALKFFEKNGEVCPINRRSGSKGLKASQEEISEFLAQREN
ncbi:MAG: hypothetical protein ACLFUC_06780 [Bacteroidales bacterium]